MLGQLFRGCQGVVDETQGRAQRLGQSPALCLEQLREVLELARRKGALAVKPRHLVAMAAFGLRGEALRLRTRIGEQLVRLAPCGVHQDRGLFLCLPNGEICGPLGEHEGTTDAVVVLLGRPVGDRPLCAFGPVGKLAHLLLQLLDREGHLLEELVDLISVVTAKAGTKLNLSQEFWRQIHARMVSVTREAMVDAEPLGPKAVLSRSR